MKKGKPGRERERGRMDNKAYGEWGPDGQGDSVQAGEDTRSRLVAAGRAAFARDGYRGATIRAITDAADANVGAVTYHFGSKEGLYHAVLLDVLSPLRERVLEACGWQGSTEGRLVRVMRAVFLHLLENPDQPRFMVGIRMDEEVFPPVVRDVMAPVVASLVEVVAAGQKEGLIHQGPPILFVLSLLSQPIYFSIVTRRAPPELVPLDTRSPDGREILLDHMVGFALRGVASGEERSGRRGILREVDR
jgi:TetR/AcrR family transcriptional regulator, regulator of cefoperazone and chloramphenicol sensitivity